MPLRALLPLLMLLTAAAAPPPVLPGPASFADLVVLTENAPVIVHARLVRSVAVGAKAAPGLAAGRVRLLATATLVDAIVAPAAVPATVDYLVDVAPDARGKPPRLTGADVLLFLRGSGGGFALSNAAGQVAWSAATEARLRAVLGDLRRPDVPRVTGIGNAFRVPGSIAGEAESQFFVTTADGRPVSLVVLSRPGEAQRLSLALGDVIDDAASGVPRDTLLWYRLACGLPRALPDAGDPDLAADYAFVLRTLGPCGRTLP